MSRPNRIIMICITLLLLAPAAEARTIRVRDCNGDHHNMASSDPGNYTDGNPADLCARGFYGFARMIFIGQIWSAPIAALALLVTGFMFFTAGGNSTRRIAAGSAAGFLALGLLFILFADQFIDTLYGIFGGG
jgi:hypothetical protein